MEPSPHDQQQRTLEFERVFRMSPHDATLQLLMYARQRSRTLHDAEDLTQATMAKVATSPPAQYLESPIAFLKTVLLHLLLDQRKSAYASREVQSDIAVLISLDAPGGSVVTRHPERPDALAISAVIRADIVNALKALPPKQRAVTELLVDWHTGDFRGLSHSEAGAMLGMTAQQVTDNLRAARPTLARLLHSYSSKDHA